MGTKPYRILLLTSDHYIKAVLPYAWLLKKNWPDHPDVLVGGFTKPDFNLPDRFSFHSIGRFSDYPITRWSDALIKFLYEIPDEVFILSLDDMFVVEPVKDQVVRMCYDYMEQFRYVARLDLTGDRLWAKGGDVSLYGRLGNVDLVWSDPGSQYHLSTMPAFWRKEHLLRVLIPGETPWQVELQGTPRLASLHKSMIVLGTNAWPMRIHLAFRGGDPGKMLLDGLSQGDIEEMSRRGLLDPWAAF